MTAITNFGPRLSVAHAHAADPANAVIWITINRRMISVMEKPSVFDANSAAKAITVFTPSSYIRYARRNRRIAVRSGRDTISRKVARVWRRPRETASRSGRGWCESAGKMTKAGIENKPNSMAGERKQPQQARLAAEGQGARKGGTRAG